MTRWLFTLLCVMLLMRGSAVPQSRKPLPPAPDQFFIGRHTFFDFGPPNDYYEVFSVHSGDKGTMIERITVTPPGDACTLPATVQIASASIDESVTGLLGKTNACTIPDKELRRELKRCKNCLVFSGADVVMQVPCGDRSRRIRMDILDRDMFDPNPKTPEHTSWTMVLLGRLDRAVGDSVMQRPLFAISSMPPVPEMKPTRLAEDLSQGRFDALFDGAPHKLSELFRQAQHPPPGPTVDLSSSSPFRPVSYALPEYPVIARMAHIAGEVGFTLDVTSDGIPSNPKFLGGHVLLQKAVESAVTGWKFPKESAGKEIRVTIDFRMNCPPGVKPKR